MTKSHETLRLARARKNRHWTLNDWKNDVWSDEIRFQLYQTNDHIRMWKKSHESMDIYPYKELFKLVEAM